AGLAKSREVSHVRSGAVICEFMSGSRARSAAGASLGPLHCAVRQADENRGHPPVLNEPDSFGQRETRRVAISRPILRQQIIGKSMPDRGLERLSSQPAPPVARVTEHWELRDPSGPALI